MTSELTDLLTTPDVDAMEARMLQHPQIDVPVTHRFAPGVYLREVLMPAGSFIIGQRHKTKHFNIVSEGRVSVMLDGVVSQIVAPCTFVSEAGVRKVLFCHEDTRWATVHATDETDIAKLELALVEKTEAFLEYEAFAKLIQTTQ